MRIGRNMIGIIAIASAAALSRDASARSTKGSRRGGQSPSGIRLRPRRPPQLLLPRPHRRRHRLPCRLRSPPSAAAKQAPPPAPLPPSIHPLLKDSGV